MSPADMEFQGKPGKNQVTPIVYEKLVSQYSFEQRGLTKLKGKGKITTYWLTGKKPIR